MRPGDEVLTVGARASTHALATALYATRLGARATVHRWPQEMNEVARRVERRLRSAAAVHDSWSVAGAYVRAFYARLIRPVRWIPAGGTTPLGILGHVDAALELAAQVRAGIVPPPRRVVVPLGSGGTAAGLLVGFALAGLHTEVVGVQVVPRVVANAGRVHRLASATRALLARAAGETPPAGGVPFSTERAFYGGAYGRETAAGLSALARFREAHPGAMLDATYSAKACAAALARCDGEATIFWLTFDRRACAGASDERSDSGARG